MTTATATSSKREKPLRPEIRESVAHRGVSAIWVEAKAVVSQMRMSCH